MASRSAISAKAWNCLEWSSGGTPHGKGSGARYLTNMPISESLYRNTSRDYPGFSLDIPDQTRADRFIAELDQRYKSGKEPLPQFLYVTLPNDHTGDDRPDAGYPYAAFDGVSR